MSERLTHSDVFGGILTNSEIIHFGGAHTGTEVAYCGEPIDKLFEIENMCYDASGNEITRLPRLRELAEADRDGRVDIRPNCEECKHQFTHYSLDPCFQCKGQSAIGEKGWMFEPKAEAARALSEASAGEEVK